MDRVERQRQVRTAGRPRTEAGEVAPTSAFKTGPIILHREKVDQGRGVRNPWIVLAVLVSVVVIAVWKPWAGTAPQSGPHPIGASASTPIGATATAAAPAPASPRAASGTGSTTGAVAGAVAGPAPNAEGARPLAGLTIAGLDVSPIGLFDGHAAWGVSVASVPRTAIVNAIQLGKAAVTPVVDWGSSAPGTPDPLIDGPVPHRSGAGPALNDSASVAIAVAVTWPMRVRPVAVELVDLGAKPSVSGGSGRGRPASPVGLVEPLPAIVRSFPSGLHAVLALARELWDLRSGTFFLPTGDLPTGPSGWLTGGWRPGRYEFRVTLPTGEVKRLAFRIVT